jgi:carboxylesterase type B
MNFNGDGYDVNPFGGNGTYPEQAKALSKTMSSAWINFVVGQNPNGGRDDPMLIDDGAWPVYNTTVGGGVGQDLVFQLDGNYVETDDWRAGGMN